MPPTKHWDRILLYPLAPWICAFTFVLAFFLLHIGLPLAGNKGTSPELLFGERLDTSIYTLMLTGAPLIAALCWLRRAGADMFSLGVFTVGALVSVFYIHISNDHKYTNDINGNLAYIRYIAANLDHPYGYRGPQNHHPPLYYYSAAMVMNMCQYLGTIPLMTSLRFLSWMYFLGFSGFSLLILRLVPLNKTVYASCVMLLLLWPNSLHGACKISAEPLYYALFAGGLYYALRWYRSGVQRELLSALLWGGGALLVRSNAILLFMYIAAFMFIAHRRGHLRIASLFNMKIFAGGLWVLLCAAINNGRLFGHANTRAVDAHWGFGGGPLFPVSHFMYLNYNFMIEHPFVDHGLDNSFWDYVLKSSLFGVYRWAHPEYAAVMELMLSGIAWYTLIALLIGHRREWRGMLPYVLTIVISLVFLIVFAAWKHSHPNQDARLIYMVLPCFVACFGHAYEIYKARGWTLVAKTGPLLAVGFSLLSVYYFTQFGR